MPSVLIVLDLNFWFLCVELPKPQSNFYSIQSLFKAINNMWIIYVMFCITNITLYWLFILFCFSAVIKPIVRIQNYFPWISFSHTLWYLEFSLIWSIDWQFLKSKMAALWDNCGYGRQLNGNRPSLLGSSSCIAPPGYVRDILAAQVGPLMHVKPKLYPLIPFVI